MTTITHAGYAGGFFAHAGAAGADSDVPPLDAHTALTQWEFAPVVTAIVVIAAALYLYGVWRVRREHPARPWPVLRTGLFIAGLLTIVIATQSSIGAYDDVLFFMHMWQHLLLLMVAPPLLLAGQPITLLLHASRNPLHTWVKRALRSKVVDAITFPLVGVTLYAVVVVGTHLTGFMDVVLTNTTIHQLEHVLYLVTGYLYFLPLIGREPIRWRLSFPSKLFLLAVAMPVDTFTGVVLLQTNHVMFPAYEGRRDWGMSVLDDLHSGGAVMWIAGDGIMFMLIILLFAGIARGRVKLDAGRWLEGARSRRFAELAIADGAGPADSAALAADAAPGDTDDDDRQLDAYNAYLAKLNQGPGSPTGSMP